MDTEAERDYPTHWEADVVLRDGGTARVRPITEADADRLVTFYEQVSDQSKYYRFFAPYPHLSDRDIHRFTHHDYVNRVALAATVGGEFIGTVRYDRVDSRGRSAAASGTAPADEAEVAFLIQDAHQGRGVASALLEHIGACARERGIRRFVAEVLPGNTKMIKVFRDAGYSQRRTFADGTVHLTLELEPTAESLRVMRSREQRAEARSVQRLLAPGSVAVIGVSRRPGGAGRTVLRTLLDAGFTGRLYAVNHAVPAAGSTLGGVPAHRSVRDIPEPVDLAVVAVPADQVSSAVVDCGERGTQGLVVLSAGHDRAEQRELVRRARSYGMRIVGPHAFGIINTAPGIRLNATLAPLVPRHGRIGLFTQSGAIGVAVLSALHDRGAGLSSFVSAGNRADVSGNDVLQYWHEDPDTDVCLMYLESVGNPRKFTRLARRTAAAKPVVIVKGARHSGSVPPPSHAAPGIQAPDATVSELLRQAGVIRVDTLTDLIDVGLLLARQPLPEGPRIAILGNSEPLGLLGYDACLTRGLRPRRPADLTGSATPEDFGRALGEALADPGTDAVVVGVTPSAVSDVPVTALADGLRAAAAGSTKPVVVTHLAVEGLDEALAECGIPTYPAAERAVLALAEAVRYARWRREAARPGRVPEYDGIDEDAADALITRALATAPARAPSVPPVPSVPSVPPAESPALLPAPMPPVPPLTLPTGAESPAGPVPSGPTGTAAPGAEPVQLAAAPPGFPGEPRRTTALGPEAVTRLLGHYGIPVLPVLPAPTPEEAARAAQRLGYPVALKTTAPQLRHRSDLGGVRLGLATENELRRAHTELTGTFGPAEELRPVVQAMAPRGVDTVVGASVDPSLGSLLSFGLAGPPSELLGDTAHRLVPVTDKDAAAMIRSIRAAPMLFGWRGAQPVDTAALEELLLRLSRLVDGHPEVVAVALEPVVVAARGLSVLGASVRLAPPPVTTDLGPRRLPAY